MKKYHYIYKTTCSVTGKFYIGMHSTDNLDDGYLGSGLILKRSIKKHGKENHTREILEFHEDRNLLSSREKDLITNDLRRNPLCMNAAPGGLGACLGTSNSEDTNRKISESMVGHYISEETRKRISISRKGKPATNARAIVVNDVEYASAKIASEVLGINLKTLGGWARSNSTKFSNIFFKDVTEYQAAT